MSVGCIYALCNRSDLGKDIDQALSKIDEMASTQEDLAAEEALILRGCVRLLMCHERPLTIFLGLSQTI